jgi:UDP-N-acetylmuramoyl-L-alanyl-D-glutamate--2,6-diaminopimelate ligase
MARAFGEAEITGITHSSRLVEPGFLFVAVPGLKVDGHSFIMQAIERGAGAVAISREVQLPSGFPHVCVEESRQALGVLSSVFYGNPSKRLNMIGITGTNGKTTTAFLTRSILRGAGRKVGLMGTVQVEIGERVLPVIHTTPEAPELQKLLHAMVNQSMTHCVMEVSSHSLALARVEGVQYDTAVFTNLTQDHLDLHGTMEEYFMAKARLFINLRAGCRDKFAVINGDDPYGQRLVQMCGLDVRVLTYGFSYQADIEARDVETSIHGSRFFLNTPWGSGPIQITAPGKHNVYNALAAAGAALAQGCTLEDVRQGLLLAGVPGRMEPVQMGQDFGVYVDYAHSPDGLENVLQAVRGFTAGRVIVVFGCGGDRDRTKRPIMGSIAIRLADVAVVTSDNPRSEDPMAIISDVLTGLQGTEEASRVLVQPDRRTAIREAIAMAKPGDVVLIAGKGHENYQIFREQTIHFDDREEARTALGAVLS